MSSRGPCGEVLQASRQTRGQQYLARQLRRRLLGSPKRPKSWLVVEAKRYMKVAQDRVSISLVTDTGTREPNGEIL